MARIMKKYRVHNSNLILKSWQHESIHNFFTNKGLALEGKTGTGKSIFLVALAIQALELGETVIIVSAPHLLDDLRAKFEEFFPTKLGNIIILDKKNKSISPNWINIISYNKFALYSKEILKSMNLLDLHTVIYDESHLLKNVGSKSYKAALKLSNIYNIKNLCTTATMQSNSNMDLFSPAHLASPDFRKEFGNFWEFTQRGNVKTELVYTATKQIQAPVAIHDFAMEKYINPNITVLGEVLEVKATEYTIVSPSSKQLEKKVVQLDDYDISNIDFNKLTAMETQRLLNTITNPSGKLLQLANNFLYDEITGEPKYFKYKEKLDLLNSIVNTEAGAGKKGVLFYFYKAEYDKIQEYYAKNKRIFYHDKDRNIMHQIREFEEGEFDLFIMNSASTSTGIRFKQSDYIIHFTTIWNSLTITQIDGRLNYSGRTSPYKIFRFTSGVRDLQYIEKRVKVKMDESKQWSESQRSN